MFAGSRPKTSHNSLAPVRPAKEHFAVCDAVDLRPMTAFDAEKLRTFLNGLSDASRRERFLRPISVLPGYLLKSLTRLDGRQHVAFMAEVSEQGSKSMVGEARYAVDPERPGEAEFAIAVDDRWQGCGIAARLMKTLEDRARAAGLQRLYADTLEDNQAMLGLARRRGYAVVANRQETGMKRLYKDFDSRSLH